MKDGKLQACVVGCGDMGRRHATGWASLPDARVAAVVDNDPQRACALAEQLNAPYCFNDYRDALQVPEIDVVSVCIPTAAHPEVSIAAAQAGKHVFCEKPIALTLEDADRMIETARSNHVRLGIGLIRRYSPVMHLLRRRLADGDLGRPVLYHAIDHRDQRPKLMMHDATLTGGAVIDMGVHIYDNWRYVFDSQAVSVYAQGLKLADGRPELARAREIAYDSAAVTVRYRSGDIGSFVVTWGLPLGAIPDEQPDRVYGPRGLAELAYSYDRQWLRWNRAAGWETLADCTDVLHSAEIAAFAASILQDRPVQTTGEEARDALRVALAAMESIRTGRAVDLE